MNQTLHPLRIVLVVLAVYLGIAAFIACDAPRDLAHYLYSEQGPYETVSVWLWLILAGQALLTRSLHAHTRITAALAALLMGAREMDLHKSLFSTSFIKMPFYKSPTISLHDKLLGGLLLLALAALLVYLGITLFRHLRNRGLSDTPTLLLVSGLFLGAVSKALDRFSSQMHELFSIEVTAATRWLIVSLEESLEMTLPLFFILALLTLRQRRC
ncbi:MAG: hypothetical protein VW625_01370 [Perlucidibaca sp.]